MEDKKNSFLEEVKLYCKIDYDFEDELLLELIESAREQISLELGMSSFSTKPLKRAKIIYSKGKIVHTTGSQILY